MFNKKKTYALITVIVIGSLFLLQDLRTKMIFDKQVETINEGYKQSSKDHNEYLERTTSKLQTLQEKIDSIKEDFNKRNHNLNIKIDTIDAAINSKSKRWGNIKRVRKIVKKSAANNRFSLKMNIIELTRYATAVVDFSTEHDVPIPLILAVTRQESAFNPKAISHAGAKGLMQLMPRTAADCSRDIGKRLSNIYHIGTNVELGTFYLRKMLTRFNNNTELALKAYNAGPNYVSKVIAKEYRRYPAETIDYSKKVLKYLEEYKSQYN